MPQQLWKLIYQILHRRPALSLPTHVSVESWCDSFLSHFKVKVALSILLSHSSHTKDIVNADFLEVNYQLASYDAATMALK